MSGARFLVECEQGVVRMNATADLRAEHEGVARMLDIMDAMARRARMGEPLDAADLSQTIEFLRVFVDRCHHAKEEGLLFPAIHAAKIASVEPTVAVLLEEHVRGRGVVATIELLAQRLGQGDEAARTDLADSLSSYTELLRDHIDREERDCFEVADRELPALYQDELAEGYERLEHDVIGEGVHEGFHALLERLSDTYLAEGSTR